MTLAVNAERLKDFSLFSEFADQPEQIKTVARYMRVQTYKAGEYIFREGDLGDDLSLLASGAVRVLKYTKTKEEYTIVDLNGAANVFFGELALMDEDKRSASIQVLENCMTYVLDRPSFLELGKQHPEIALPITQAIAKIISGRLRSVNDDVILLFDALVNEVESNHL